MTAVGFIMRFGKRFFAEFMMDNRETAEILAKGKLKLTAVIFMMAVLFGLMTEYMRNTKPTAEAVIIYRAAYKPERAEVVAPVAEAKPAEKAAVSEAAGKGISAAEFTGYLQEIHERAMAVSKPESALEKIVLPKAEAAPVVADVPDELVIYDNDEPVAVEKTEAAPVAESVAEVEEVAATETAQKGEAETVTAQESLPVAAESVKAPETVNTDEAVLSVIEESEEEVLSIPAGAVTEADAAEVDAAVENAPKNEVLPEDEAVNLLAGIEESQTEKAVSSEPVVNTEKNDAEMIETEVDAPAIDMMKDIMAREQAAADEK